MRFARPPEGFKIVLSELAAQTIENASNGAPRLPEVWTSICERLKFTAHREGQLLPDNRQIIQFDGDQSFGIPTIAVKYVVVGDRVEIERILVRV